MSFLYLKKLKNYHSQLVAANTPADTIEEKDALEVASWIEAKITTLENEEEEGCYASNILPSHLNTNENISRIRSTSLYY